MNVTRTSIIHLDPANSEGMRQDLPCTFCEFQARRLTLLVGEPVSRFRPVSVEYDDTMFLGEVLSCRPLDGAWSVEVAVEQILNGLESLVALRNRLMGETVNAQPKLVAVR